jgi:hypothetical protein
MLPTQGSDPLWRYCEQLDRSLPFLQLRLEDIEVTNAMILPLEMTLAHLPECPRLPDSPAGRTGAAVWARLHPNLADPDVLIQDARDDHPIVRFAVAGALQASCEEQNNRWQDPSFATRMRETLQDWFEHEDSPTIAFLLKNLLDGTAKFVRHPRRPRSPIRVNPYVAGVPVKDAYKFFGRQDVLNEIASKLGKSLGVKSLILYGARRTGKTSILLRIKSGALGDAFVPVYVDMQGFAGVDANTFLASVAQAAVNALIASGITVSVPSLPSPTDREFRLAFQAVVKELLSVTSLNLLLLIDEYEVLLEYIKNDPTLALQLQHLVESEANLYFVFAGSHTIESIAKHSSVPLLDAARYLKINFLSRESALDLIVKLGEGLVVYAPGVPEKVVDLTGGHPFYTQLICQVLFEVTTSAGKSEVTPAQLKQAVEIFMRDPSPHLILTWNALQHEEKVAGSTLAVLADEGQPVKPTQILLRLEEEGYPSPPDPAILRNALGRLRDEGWVEEKLPEGTYRFSMELVREWVTANRSIDTLRDEQCKRLTQASAPAWRQWSAVVIDAVILIVAIGVGFAISFPLQETYPLNRDVWPVVGMAAFGLLYFLTPMLIGRFTIGLRLLNLYPTNRQLIPLGPGRAAGYGLLLLTRELVMFFTAACFIAASEKYANGNKIYLELGILGTAVIVADIVMMHRGAMRRGLYERLGGIALMHRK